MIRQIGLGLIIVLVLLGCDSGKIRPYIVGKWREYKVETKNGGDTTTFGIKLTPFQEWEFTDMYYINFRKEKVEYHIKNDTIFFRNEPWYLIEKLNKDTLIAIEIYTTGYNPNSQRSYFTKIK